ncbi:DUF6517 family protein [Halorientalis brevis]|uniref:DUF6517 family protein n=1 Tax=Halorientalis brevis TaxID=1126241 RepID=A0ABD6CDG6_9EURY|nr:DUF6517 family protein [Halorientalis brevis]
MDKRILALGGLITLLALSGCVGFITGESLVFEASPAAVSNSSAAESGFTLQQYNETNLNQTVAVFGVEREISLSFHQAIYAKRLPGNLTREDVDRSTLSKEPQPNQSLQPTVVTVVSVPDAQVFGQSVNPLVQLPNDELVERFGGGSDGSVSNLEQESERSVQMLGSEPTLTVFNGTTQSENGQMASRISVVKTAHEGDVVVLISVQPQDNADDDALDAFIADMEHPTDAPN